MNNQIQTQVRRLLQLLIHNFWLYLVRERLELYAKMLKEIDQFHQEILVQAGTPLKRLMHNLISQNAHNIQEVYSVTAQEVLSLSMGEQIENVAQSIRDDPIVAARALLRINKNNIAMRCEFTAFRFLHETTKAPLKKRPHNIRKVVMNVLHPFFQDFKDKNIYVDADELYNSNVKVDYDTIQVALYHIIENASKYTLPDTRLKISYPVVEGRQVVSFNMISLQISDEDMEHIFEEGYSGELPRQLHLAGAGLGMALITKLLALNDAVLAVHRNIDYTKRHTPLLGVYENNQFDIVLGKPF